MLVLREEPEWEEPVGVVARRGFKGHNEDSAASTVRKSPPPLDVQPTGVLLEILLRSDGGGPSEEKPPASHDPRERPRATE